MSRYSGLFRRLRLVGGFAMVGMAGTSAQADDRLMFQVRGAVTPSCGLATDRIRIELGTVAASELGAIGGASRWRRASFIGTGCIGATRATVTMRAKPHPLDPRYLATDGDRAAGERGVGIEVRAAGGQSLPPDGSSSVGFTWAEGAPELAFEARYVRLGALNPGNAQATALVQIQWE